MNKAKHNNGRRHSTELKLRAAALRNIGKTHREIAKTLEISLGSASLWTKKIQITPEQKLAIEKRRNKLIMTPELKEKLRKHALTNLLPTRKKYTRDSLLEKIVSFHKKFDRIPLKREFNMYDEYQRQFGSWNAAIKAAGFKTNPIIFAYKFKSKDGHNCDSFTEKIIDEWLMDHQIPHERNHKYANTRMTADFLIKPNTILEFFGLAGVQKQYDKNIEKKRARCKNLNLKLIEIYPADIFENKNLPQLLNELL